MSDKRRIEGDMACQAGFLVLPECLDQSFESRTACFPLTVKLPRLDTNLHQVNLVAPFSILRADEDAADAAEARYPGDSKWGCLQDPQDNPDDWQSPIHGYAMVERLRFTTEGAAADDDQLQHSLDHFGTEQIDWWTKLADWIGIVSSQDLVGLGRSRSSASFERISIWTGGADGRVSGFTKLDFGHLRPYAGDPLTKGELATCMALAGKGIRPSDEWLLIRDARSLLNSREYRRAVIDAGTAAELALTALLEEHLSNRDDPATIKALLDRTETLGGRTKLASQLIPDKVPHRLQQEVTEPRNNAAHKNDLLTEATATAAIAKATELVEIAYPLEFYGFSVS